MKSDVRSVANPQIIIALDNCNFFEACQLVDKLSDLGITWFKVGLELFTSSGHTLVEYIKKKNLNVFLDLKLFDIPNTVKKATVSASNLGANLLTLHCAGGLEMLAEAKAAVQNQNIELLGVSVLTSFGLNDFNLNLLAWSQSSKLVSTNELLAVRAGAVSSFIDVAAQAKLDGIVCSGLDLKIPNIALFKNKKIVVPGIRLPSDQNNDQKSVETPQNAIQKGATHLVVGRPITNPQDGSVSDAVQQFFNAIKVEAS